MKDQLITFETAKLAKEKGFDIKTLYYGDIRYYESVYYSGNSNGEVYGYDGEREFRLMFPTQSLLQKWFRDVHQIYIEITLGHDEDKIWYNCYIYNIKLGYEYDQINLEDINGYSFEESLESGLKEAFKYIKK